MTYPMRTESVYQKAIDTVTNLDTTGENVFRDRTNPVPANKLPCICVYMGDDTKIAEYSHGVEDWELEVFFDAKVRVTDTPLTRELLKIRGEIKAAMEANYTMGLSYVHRIIAQSVAEPKMSQEGDQPIAVMRIPYKIQYRTTRTDPGA